MVVVKQIDAMSWAKVYTAVVLIVMSVMAVPFVLIATLVGSVQGDEALLAGPAVAVIVVLGLVPMAIFVFLISLIQAVVFNWALSRTGGVRLEVEHLE